MRFLARQERKTLGHNALPGAGQPLSVWTELRRIEHPSEELQPKQEFSRIVTALEKATNQLESLHALPGPLECGVANTDHTVEGAMDIGYCDQ